MRPESKLDWYSLALEYSLYGFLLLLLIAVLLSVAVWRWLTEEHNPLAFVPDLDPPDSETLREMERLLSQVREHLKQTPDEERTQVEEEQDRLARWYTEFKDELERAREPFQESVKRQREQWRKLFVHVQQRPWWKRLRGRKHDAQYQDLLQQYLKLEQQTNARRQTLQAYDRVSLRNFQSSALFQKHHRRG